MNVLEAFELVRVRTTEHVAGGEGGGLTVVLEQCGIDPDDMEAAMPSVFYEHTIINMPVPSQLVAAFAAGAVYTRANHSSLPDAPPEVDRAAIVEALEEVPAGTEWTHAGMVDLVLDLAFGGPAAGPPTDDGAEEP